jgi:HD-GYP domain-containing protein (c-di-GMP phosphodiesterase class II)
MVKSGHGPRGLLALLAAWAVGVPAVLHAFGGKEVQTAPWVHFALVATGALVAGIASIGLTLAGARANDGRTVLLGAAFSTMTALLLIHGLATPGIIVGPNGVIALAGAASLPAGGAVLALTALPAMRRPLRLRPVLAIQAVLAAAILLLGAIGLAFPSAVPGVPAAGSAPAVVLLGFGLAFFALLALRAVRTYTLTHRTTDLLVFVGCVWLGWALVPQLIMGYGTLAFYFGHAMELLGIILVGIPAALDLRQGGASRPLVGDLTAIELVGAEEAFLGPRVRALMVDLAEKDRSTEEHTRRVATLACAVGEELKLPPASLRHLAIGGLLHDMGKLRVPPSILCNPGALTADEFDVIKRHPEDGVRLLANLGGFDREVHDLVLDHHERLDGGGYPRGVHGEQIALATRVLTVCDVYDALVSHRVYRPAWSRERALGLLHEESGTAFDPNCVAALERVLDRALDDPGWIATIAPAEAPVVPARAPR